MALLKWTTVSFTVRLVSDTFPVEPGSSAAVAVEVTNGGTSDEVFELAVEGIGSDWVALPVPSFTVAAGDQVVERFFIKPPRESSSRAGNYPFVVKVRSLESGDAKSVQGSLEIEPYNNISVDVNPRKASVSPTSKSASFSVTVMNLGNQDLTVGLGASDTDNEFAYEFSDDQFQLSPGSDKEIHLTTTMTQSHFVSSSKLSVVTVSARNTFNPSASASSQIHLEQRPFISPSFLIGLIALLVLGILWFLNIPEPPKVVMFSLDRQEIVLGETAVVQWDTRDASSVELSMEGGQTLGKLPAKGSSKIKPTEVGEIHISIRAISGKKSSEIEVQTLVVKEPERVPEPGISEFKPEKSKIPVGDTFLMIYSLNEAVTSAYLEPIGPLDVGANSIQIKAPSDPGKITYSLIARNSAGQETKKSVTVEFIKVTQANIISFKANPEVFDPLDGKVVISWQISDAVRAELAYDGKTVQVDPLTGSMEVLLTKDTEIVLTAFDEEGLTAVKEIQAKAKEPPVEPPVEDDTAGDTTGGTGGRTSETTGG